MNVERKSRAAGDNPAGNGGAEKLTPDYPNHTTNVSSVSISSQLDAAQADYEAAAQLWRERQDSADLAAAAMFAQLDRLRGLRRGLPAAIELESRLEALNEALKAADDDTVWIALYEQWLETEGEFSAVLAAKRAEESAVGDGR